MSELKDVTIAAVASNDDTGEVAAGVLRTDGAGRLTLDVTKLLMPLDRMRGDVPDNGRGVDDVP